MKYNYKCVLYFSGVSILKREREKRNTFFLWYTHDTLQLRMTESAEIDIWSARDYAFRCFQFCPFDFLSLDSRLSTGPATYVRVFAESFFPSTDFCLYKLWFIADNRKHDIST